MNGYTFKGGSFVKMFCQSLFWKGVYSKRKECGSKFFPFGVDFFLEGAWCAGKQTRNHKSCLPWCMWNIGQVHLFTLFLHHIYAKLWTHLQFLYQCYLLQVDWWSNMNLDTWGCFHTLQHNKELVKDVRGRKGSNACIGWSLLSEHINKILMVTCDVIATDTIQL